MGWAGGSEIMNAVIDATRQRVPDESVRQAIYMDIIPVLNDHDWDTQYESMDRDPAFDQAWRAVRRRAR